MARTLSNTSLPFGALTVHRAVSGAYDLIGGTRDWIARRRTATALRQLDQRQLDDIGLTLADIERFERTGHF